MRPGRRCLGADDPVAARDGDPEDPHSPLHRLEHAIHPWVGYGVVPIFGFANAGVSFAGLDASVMLGPVPLGIAFGLFVGKQVGVFGIAWATVRLGFADMPDGATMPQLYGVALLCGIGFTMSLFIGGLAFAGSPDAVGRREGRRARRVDHLRDWRLVGVPAPAGRKAAQGGGMKPALIDDNLLVLQPVSSDCHER